MRFLDTLANRERVPIRRDEFKLDGIRRLLSLAGEPQSKMPPVVLVAGTKGKGSVCYLLDAGLRGCGLRTGLFVSPHVRDVRERIQMNGRPVGPQVFARLVTQLRPLVRRQPVSYFELSAAMAFKLFASARPDYVLTEVGLGGRLDATNLTEPAVSVITRIGLDHLEVLGKTKRRIAREKAGIMRSNRPVVIAPQSPEVMRELIGCARRTGAIPVPVGERTRAWDVICCHRGTSFSCFTDFGPCRVEIPLLGRHQVENCLTALVVLAEMAEKDSRIRLANILDGWRSVMVPARCQVVRESPITVVDSCHNPDSGAALAAVIRDCIGEPVILVYGSLRNKLVGPTVAPLVPHVASAVVTQPATPRAMDVSTLERTFRRLGIGNVETAPNVRAAIHRAMLLAGTVRPLVVAGSFYVAGEALDALDSCRYSSILNYS